MIQETLPAIDWALCINLANNKEAVAKEVLSLVLEQLPSDLKVIQAAHEQDDAAELLRYVHKVHGALCYTGLPALKEVVLQMESALKRQNISADERTQMLVQLKREIDRALEAELPF